MTSSEDIGTTLIIALAKAPDAIGDAMRNLLRAHNTAAIRAALDCEAPTMALVVRLLDAIEALHARVLDAGDCARDIGWIARNAAQSLWSMGVEVEPTTIDGATCARHGTALHSCGCHRPRTPLGTSRNPRLANEPKP